MHKKKKQYRKLPGAGARLLSMLPVLNWISLIYIGIKCSSTISIICGVLYGILTFAVPSLATILWLVALIQYAIVHNKIKKTIDTQRTSFSGNVISSKTDQSYIDVHSEVRMQDVPQVRTASTTMGYTDMTLPGDPENKQTIPLRDAILGVSHDASVYSRTTETINTGTSNSENDFDLDFLEGHFIASSDSKLLRDMMEFADKTGSEAKFVPFMEYYPSYDSMNRQQKAWYFYWRTEVRNKNYLDTDLSYIYVHIYELICGCGWQDAQNGLDQLMALWMAYRESFPRLDHSLFDWTFDFAQQHELKYRVPDVVDLPLPYQPAIKDLLIDQHIEDRPLKLSFAMIEALCDYSIVNSRFYKDGHQLLMQEAIPRIVALADAALLKKGNRGILEIYGPNRARKQSYYAFQGAICPNAGKKIDVSVKAYTSSQKLRGYINELVRYSENALRSLYGYRGRLRGVTLDENTANLVDAFLQKEYSPTCDAQDTSVHETKVELDFNSIDVLRAQSDAVREALNVPEEAEITKEVLAEPAREREYLIVEGNQWDESNYNDTHKPDIASPNGLVPTKEDTYFERTALSDQMNGLLGELTTIQKRTLFIILSKADSQSELEQIAEEAMTMPEILIDDINDVATQFLDDILLDSQGDAPSVLEQYESELKNALRYGGTDGDNY